MYLNPSIRTELDKEDHHADAQDQLAAQVADATEEMVEINPSRESREWSMNSRHQPKTEPEKPRLPRKLKLLLIMPEKKWKEWPINKKRMLPTRKSQTLETKPPRKPIRLPQVLVLEVLLMPPSRRLKMLPRH